MSMRVSRPESFRASSSSTEASGHRGAVLDDRRRQRVLRPEMEVHRALGDFRIGENVVEADQAVRLACELVRRRAQDLQPRGVRSSIDLFGHLQDLGIWTVAPVGG